MDLQLQLFLALENEHKQTSVMLGKKTPKTSQNHFFLQDLGFYRVWLCWDQMATCRQDQAGGVEWSRVPNAEQSLDLGRCKKCQPWVAMGQTYYISLYMKYHEIS